MPPKKKVANGYKFAEPLPKGTILEDIAKAKWRLGPSIGQGGFGEIYSAQSESTKGSTYPYVVKIEPHSNGPLFVEINFYIRNSKQADIEEFIKSRGLKFLGMPVYLGSGSHEYKSEKYRFLVMEKFGTDLHKLYMENGKKFPTKTVFQVGVQIVDTLEYIHSRGYVHADIKGANILMGATKETQNKQVYLVDFGLATKFSTDKDFKPNPKKAHDGTIEYLSRDAHQGVQTRRSDLEILAYNMIQWLGCILPWESNLSDPKLVQQSKEANMKDVSKMVKACFKDGFTAPKAIVDFLKYLHTLKFDTEPDYRKIRKTFIAGVKDAGGSMEASLSFSENKTPNKRKAIPAREAKSPKRSKNNQDSEESDSEPEPAKPKKAPAKKGTAKNDTGDAASSSDGKIIEKPKRAPPKGRLGKTAKKEEQSESSSGSVKENSMEGFTEAMKQIMLKKLENESNKKGSKKTGTKKADFVGNGDSNSMDGFNDEMKEIAMKKGTKGRSATKKKATEYAKESDSETEGFNDGMKEVAAKKKGRKVKKAPNEAEESGSDMEGFNDGMKEVAAKKSKRKAKNPVPIPTTSKAKPERGLVNPESKKLLSLLKAPSTHLEVIKTQDNTNDSSDFD